MLISHAVPFVFLASVFSRSS